MIDYDVDGDGIATLTWALTDSPMNVLNAGSVARLTECVDRALGDDAVKGVIVTSSKPEFVVGGDLNELLAFKDRDGLTAHMNKGQAVFRRIETGGKPFVAALNGTALGGGYELALACHHRIAADDPKLRVGLPEITLGLFPGAGGTQRLPRQIGVKAAIDIILGGRSYTAQQAFENGMVDAVVAPDQLLAEAKAWLMAANEDAAVKPWDRRGYRMPDSAIQVPTASMFTALNAAWHERTHGNNPAVKSVLSAVYEGSIVDIDTALAIETKSFVKCALAPEAKNTIRTMFFSVEDAKKLKRRPAGVPPEQVSRAGVVGAGFMGAAIAYCIARSGAEVTLIDSSQELAEKGKAYSDGVLAREVERGRMSADDKEAVLARIYPAADVAALADCSFVIEAVFEDRAVKAEVYDAVEKVIGKDAILASNTSTLPISGLAADLDRPANFIGTHFFSPADRMPLIEIITGAKTGKTCLARTMDFMAQIRKTPIVVGDSRGFFTSRTVGTYVNEGMIMLAEGVAPALIENAGRMAGMPVGPLALTDEVALELMYNIRRQTKADLGKGYSPNPSDGVLEKMVEQLGRKGRKSGGGFYDYPEDEPKRLWPGLAENFPAAAEQPPAGEVIRRLIYVQCVEAARCLEENVITDPRDGDVGSVLGWGFPAFRGGVISQIHTLGIARFVAECEEMTAKYGARFVPPAMLQRMAQEERTFYDD
jgi:3-hydroxyacyl-CoA dehydrogenase/enoyl-CoA hydratase/3-hydroxybutyryl-CoA epimerase